MSQSALIEQIDDFLSESGMTATAFGKETVGDPNFVHDLRRGREPRSRTVRQVEAYIAANRPSIAPADAADEPERAPS